jgi:hypothetical protein
MSNAEPLNVNTVDHATASSLPWYRRSKFQAWLMVTVILFGAVGGIPMLLIFWTGKVERPRLTNKPWTKPYYSRGIKGFWSVLIIGIIILHFCTMGV